ncbi:MAG: hypothetical protein ACTSXP_13130, partial [Promethearchaeota archaeon]
MIKGEIEGIKIGHFLLNFKLLPIEGSNLIFLVVSRGFSDASANHMAERLAEDFSINFENFLQQKNITLEEFQRKYNFYRRELTDFYSPLCEQAVNDLVHKQDAVFLDVTVRVPLDLLKYIYDLISKNPSLGKLYKNGSIDVIVENIQNYIYSHDFKEILNRKYNLACSSNSVTKNSSLTKN